MARPLPTDKRAAPRAGAVVLREAGAAALGASVTALALAALLAGAAPAQNPAAHTSGEFNTPYGYGYGQQEQSFEAGTRDGNGNRTIINGRMLLGEQASTLPPALGGDLAFGGFSGAASPFAIGNQLNVVVQGSYNTVIVDSTQNNYGDVSANVTAGAYAPADPHVPYHPDAAQSAGTVLNGELDLND